MSVEDRQHLVSPESPTATQDDLLKLALEKGFCVGASNLEFPNALLFPYRYELNFKLNNLKGAIKSEGKDAGHIYEIEISGFSPEDIGGIALFGVVENSAYTDDFLKDYYTGLDDFAHERETSSASHWVTRIAQEDQYNLITRRRRTYCYAFFQSKSNDLRAETEVSRQIVFSPIVPDDSGQGKIKEALTVSNRIDNLYVPIIQFPLEIISGVALNTLIESISAGNEIGFVEFYKKYKSRMSLSLRLALQLSLQSSDPARGLKKEDF